MRFEDLAFENILDGALGQNAELERRYNDPDLFKAHLEQYKAQATFHIDDAATRSLAKREIDSAFEAYNVNAYTDVINRVNGIRDRGFFDGFQSDVADIIKSAEQRDQIQTNQTKEKDVTVEYNASSAYARYLIENEHDFNPGLVMAARAQLEALNSVPVRRMKPAQLERVQAIETRRQEAAARGDIEGQKAAENEIEKEMGLVEQMLRVVGKGFVQNNLASSSIDLLSNAEKVDGNEDGLFHRVAQQIDGVEQNLLEGVTLDRESTGYWLLEQAGFMTAFMAGAPLALALKAGSKVMGKVGMNRLAAIGGSRLANAAEISTKGTAKAVAIATGAAVNSAQQTADLIETARANGEDVDNTTFGLTMVATGGLGTLEAVVPARLTAGIANRLGAGSLIGDVATNAAIEAGTESALTIGNALSARFLYDEDRDVLPLNDIAFGAGAGAVVGGGAAGLANVGERAFRAITGKKAGGGGSSATSSSATTTTPPPAAVPSAAAPAGDLSGLSGLSGLPDANATDATRVDDRGVIRRVTDGQPVGVLTSDDLTPAPRPDSAATQVQPTGARPVLTDPTDTESAASLAPASEAVPNPAVPDTGVTAGVPDAELPQILRGHQGAARQTIEDLHVISPNGLQYGAGLVEEIEARAKTISHTQADQMIAELDNPNFWITQGVPELQAQQIVKDVEAYTANGRTPIDGAIAGLEQAVGSDGGNQNLYNDLQLTTAAAGERVPEYAEFFSYLSQADPATLADRNARQNAINEADKRAAKLSDPTTGDKGQARATSAAREKARIYNEYAEDTNFHLDNLRRHGLKDTTPGGTGPRRDFRGESVADLVAKAGKDGVNNLEREVRRLSKQMRFNDNDKKALKAYADDIKATIANSKVRTRREQNYNDSLRDRVDNPDHLRSRVTMPFKRDERRSITETVTYARGGVISDAALIDPAAVPTEATTAPRAQLAPQATLAPGVSNYLEQAANPDYNINVIDVKDLTPEQLNDYQITTDPVTLGDGTVDTSRTDPVLVRLGKNRYIEVSPQSRARRALSCLGRKS